MKNTLETLDQIQRVKTPPFLFTRIESKINEVVEPIYSFKLIASMSFVLLILTVANFSVLQNDLLVENDSDISVIAEGVHSSNQLYNE